MDKTRTDVERGSTVVFKDEPSVQPNPSAAPTRSNTTESGDNSQPALTPAFVENLRESMAPRPATKPPKDALQAVYAAGVYKAGLSLDILCVQSFMAGMYIAMAGHLFLAVGGGILGAAMFPTGLLAVVLTSAELFTGDSLVFVAAVLGGKVSFKFLIRNWSVSWVCNFLGCVCWAYFMSYLSDAIDDAGARDLAISVAYKKVHQTWGQILLKGIGANFMVCLSVWQATCAEEVAGKVLALWFPVAGFVAMGFDHVIANQFFIALGMMFGADISMKQFFFEALLPATIGNAIGGGLFVGAVYW
eukprot:CAMPEP_0198155806 /NCGR_PEP_ID=MMETSP1443-20131203/69327_1 /TAXON_ID=186043 /ORGANISM="Entomoneis sp., Strain CCMP2396" /LENGTH=302 /DNA_ID=CAMNT_0043822571 /DNA_START=59 /DNA_END=964 /DNA_ORIENTATION=+